MGIGLHKLKMYLLFAAATMLLLSSCSFVSEGGTDLLQAPILNKRQAELQASLERTLNLSEVVMCYPVGGEHRSPFVFYDLDGDGLDEAIVFYSYANSDGVRASIFTQEADGAWTNVYGIAGQGDQVGFVQFSPLLDAETNCLVIGWTNSRGSGNVLEVYSLSDGYFQRQVQLDYSRHLIYDFNADGLSDILLITGRQTGVYELLLLQAFGNHLMTVDSLELEPEAAFILQMLRGQLPWDRSHAIYIDAERDNGTIATEVISVQGNRLLPVAAAQNDEDSEEYGSYRSTMRGERIVCVDLFGDGVIEVPRMLDQRDDPNMPGLTEYRHLSPEGYTSAYHAAVNQEDGYLVFFPEGWVGEVTIVSRPELREWQFYRMDTDSDAPTEELLRVRIYTAGDYMDRFTQNYFWLGQRGLYTYYGYIPERDVHDEFYITQDMASNLFLLLDSPSRGDGI